MKIAVNAQLLRKNDMYGMGWFAYNTLKHIVEQNPEVEFHFLFDSAIEDEFIFNTNVIAHHVKPKAKSIFLKIFWQQWSVRRKLREIKPDLFLSPDGSLCIGWNGKQYAVIHDINFFHNSSYLNWKARIYYNSFFPKFAKKASRIGTVSTYSKLDIINAYGIAPDKIDVVYNGVNSFFTPVPEDETNKTKSELTDGENYFIFIGSLQPRKNILRLLQAFELFKKRTKSPFKLVIAGKEMYKVSDIYTVYDGMMFKGDVIFTGRVPDEKINAVLGSAYAMVFVPLFEGFGIPVIEAMQCNVPVICSNVTSIPEVAGDAALLVDPYNVEQLSVAMGRIYRDDSLRCELIEKGKKQKTLFSWENTANLLWNGILECL